MKSSVPQRTRQWMARLRGMTLAELMISIAIGMMVVAALASLSILAVRTVQRNQMADLAESGTRKVQETLNREFSLAVIDAQKPITRPRPTFDPAYLDPAPPPGSPTTYYSRVDYRVSAGPYPQVLTTQSTSDLSGHTYLDVICAPEMVPKIGFYLLCDAPDLGTGVALTRVDDPSPVALPSPLPPGTPIGARAVRLNFAGTNLQAEAVKNGDSITKELDAFCYVSIQHPYRLDVVKDNANGDRGAGHTYNQFVC